MDVQRWFARRSEIELILWPPKSPYLNILEHMWATLKEGRILRYGNNRLYLGRLYARKMPGSHRCRWHVDKVLSPHVVIFLFALNCLFFFVLLGRKFISLCIQNYLFILLSYVQPTHRWWV